MALMAPLLLFKYTMYTLAPHQLTISFVALMNKTLYVAVKPSAVSSIIRFGYKRHILIKKRLYWVGEKQSVR